jgi:hypothetical protein
MFHKHYNKRIKSNGGIGASELVLKQQLWEEFYRGKRAVNK